MKLSLNSGFGKPVSIYTGSSVPESLNDFMEDILARKEKVFILADENTTSCCLPALLSQVPGLQSAEVLEIRPGEKYKTLETAGMIWNSLAEKRATRHSFLINLGGGVVTDLGGFVASTFKRGIPFIHIPTTLLGMADASVGGKTAINLKNIKNQLGTFQNPEAIFISTGFLKTLDNYQVLGGMAEIVKAALVADEELWNKLCSVTLSSLLKKDVEDDAWVDLVTASVALKCSIVEQDFRDKGIREILNFGHTLGHAFESLSLQEDRKALSHGHAVVLGMICESYLSSIKTGLNNPDREKIVRMILSEYAYYPLADEDLIFLSGCILQDKKRSAEGLRFSLLEKPGKAVTGITCNSNEILESINFYRKFEG
jgi:3-dehydroquinate synthase